MTVKPARLVGAYVSVLLIVQADWVLTGKHVPEGAHLMTFSPDHGLTLSDVVAFALIGLAITLFYAVVFGRRDAGRARRG